MKALKVALVMPNHFDINSSLNNFIKTYQYMIKNRNIEVTLFTDRKNDVKVRDFKIQKINGLDYKTIFEKILFVLGIPRFYYKDIVEKLKGFDVITANNPEFYAYACQAYKAAKKYNTRFILRTSQTVEGFFLYNLTKYIVNPIAKKAYDYASYTIFTNPQAEERCLKLGLIDSKKKSVITGHATDTATFKPIKVVKSKKTILLSVGGLYKIKGHDIIIKALKNIIDNGHKNTELWIVGKGYYENYLRNLVKKLKVEKNVKFLGSKGHNELAKIYNMSGIFVLANYQEITPAVNEALACEKPVVVMECGGRDFVIPNESYGLVSKKLDIDDMAEKILLLINNPKLAAKIAKNGRKRILEKFSIEKVAERLYKSFTK
ncbi:MAG: glycosyltransferase family 4 protein [Nanoarchaeota archaeon]